MVKKEYNYYKIKNLITITNDGGAFKLKNKSTLNNVEKIEDYIKPAKIQLNLLTHSVNMLLGFLLAVGNVCGEISPFGISISAAVPQSFALTTSTGALIGYLIAGGNNMKYIISIFLIAIFRCLLENIKYLPQVMLGCLSIISSSFIFMVISGNLDFYNILICLSESAMVGGTTFFFMQAKKYLANKTHYKGLSSGELSVIFISFIIILIPLMSINFLGLGLGKIVAIYSILFIALNMDLYNSSIIGMMVGFVVLLNGNENNGYVILSYGLGGVLAGLANKYGSLFVTSIFATINGIFLMLAAIVSGENNYEHLLELIVASFIFVFTSNFLKSKISLVKSNDVDTLSCDNAKNLMLLKLSLASKTLRDIAGATQRLSDKLSKNSKPTIDEIYHKCATKICSKCDLKMFCWNTAYNDTINSFNDMTFLLKNQGKINIDEVSNFMKTKCRNIDEIVTTVNDSYNRFIANKGAERKVAEIRNVVTDQFDGMAMMLKELANEFCEISQFDRRTSIQAKKVFMDIGLNVYAITSFIDKYGRLTIEATTNMVKNTKAVGQTIALELSEKCERIFELPAFNTIDNNMKVTIIEKANYTVDFGVSQLSCNNAKDCGDAYDYFMDSKGKAYMILSDGMGTGSRAAIDGALTTGLLSRLIKAGFDFEAALKMVNSALLIKSGDESLATVDVTSIDLYTGKTNIYKAGAAPTFIKKSDRALEVECTSLPAGILRGVAFDRKTINLKNQDIVIMVSDGVTNNEYNWIYNEIKSFKYNITAKELARKIALESKFRTGKGHDDDVTVMVGIITKGV